MPVLPPHVTVKTPDPIYVELLELALSKEVGIRVPSHNGGALKAILYGVKRSDPRYDCLRITNSPDDHNEVWIIQKKHYTPSQGRYAMDVWDEDGLSER